MFSMKSFDNVYKDEVNYMLHSKLKACHAMLERNERKRDKTYRKNRNRLLSYQSNYLSSFDDILCLQTLKG
jgi:hypothetical protein